MDYKNSLDEKINNLISGKLNVSEFEKEYYDFFLEQVPKDLLSVPQTTFYGLVQERLDWTSEKPNEQEKKDGWFDYEEYVAWLKNNVQEFHANEEQWYTNHLKSFNK
jgi:hypothetical protein